MVNKMRFNKSENSRLSLAQFSRLIEIFDKNGWTIDDTGISENKFEMFCKMLELLDDKQQKLILDLTDNFLWIGIQKYTAEIKNVFLDIVADNNKEILDTNLFHIVPMAVPDDINKSKSSTFITYIIKSENGFYESLVNKKIFVHDNYNILLSNANKINIENSKIFLIDDFIGSGETAEKALKYLISNGIDKNKIIVLALVAQREGLIKIEPYNLKTYVSLIRDKGISAAYAYEEALEKIQIMDTIEDKINVKQQFRHGYSDSQALVSMMRTPNNTFPIFWLPNKIIQYPPFIRVG